MEIVVKKGPFGVQFAEAGMLDKVLGSGQRFASLKDANIAYQQLLGIIGKPQIFVQRLADWRKKAPANHLKALQQADKNRDPLPNSELQCTVPGKQPLNEHDWAIVLSSPLLSMFENNQKFQLIAQEFQSQLRISGSFDVKRYHRVPAAPPKVAALSLDATSVLYVLPSALPVIQLSSLDRYSVRVTQGLKVSAQFELNSDSETERLILPQPSPKTWSAFTAANRRLPADDLQPDAAPPYWQIEISEFSV